MTVLTDLNVSRETMGQLTQYVELVEKWNPKINLISRSSVPHLWDRHIADSAQVVALAPRAGHWVDLGSGGGFPGMVAAILSKGAGLKNQFTFVESDQRKCVFLQTVVRELGLEVAVLPQRIEEIGSLHADILSARALADLETLLVFAERHMKVDGIALFLKGANWLKEDAVAQTSWSYRCEAIRSKTNGAAAILRIQDVARV